MFDWEVSKNVRSSYFLGTLIGVLPKIETAFFLEYQSSSWVNR